MLIFYESICKVIFFLSVILLIISSAKCQIIHWRSGHKYECSESEITADEARPTHDHGTSKLVEKSEMVRFL